MRDDQPLTAAKLLKIYDKIYKAKEVIHRSKGDLGPYGSHDNRDKHLMGWIKKNIPTGGKVLDASCGRGHLMVALRNAGYEAEGTEASKVAVNRYLSKMPFKTYHLTYDELDQLPACSYDCVVSNDVLEHLPDLEYLTRSIKKLVALSRRGIAISVGTKAGAHKYPAALDIRVRQSGRRDNYPDLHRIVRGARRWQVFLSRYIDLDRSATIVCPSNAYMFGFVRHE